MAQGILHVLNVVLAGSAVVCHVTEFADLLSKQAVKGCASFKHARVVVASEAGDCTNLGS